MPFHIRIFLIAILVLAFAWLLNEHILYEPKIMNSMAMEGEALAGTKVRTGPKAGPLRVDPTNPRYFTNGSGKAIYMAGGHTWYNIHYNSKNKRMSDSEFDDVP